MESIRRMATYMSVSQVNERTLCQTLRYTVQILQGENISQMIHSAAAAARLERSPSGGAPSSPVTATASVSKGGRGVHRPFAPFGLVGVAVAAAGAGLREVELSGHVLEEAVRVLVVAGPFDLGHAQRDGRIEAR